MITVIKNAVTNCQCLCQWMDAPIVKSSTNQTTGCYTALCKHHEMCRDPLPGYFRPLEVPLASHGLSSLSITGNSFPFLRCLRSRAAKEDKEKRIPASTYSGLVSPLWLFYSEALLCTFVAGKCAMLAALSPADLVMNQGYSWLRHRSSSAPALANDPPPQNGHACYALPCAHQYLQQCQVGRHMKSSHLNTSVIVWLPGLGNLQI